MIAIGGDGTFRGARELSKYGVNTIGIPGTIDNDIACSHYSIGFDTAANTAIEAIDKLSDTMQSHQRTSVVEIMGRNAGHLAVYVGISVGATAIILPERPFDFEADVVEHIREAQYRGKHHHLIIVAEGTNSTNEIAQRCRDELGLDTRVTIIGHVQRGGSPSARDRVMATRMGHRAVEEILAGGTNLIVCYRNSQITTVSIDEAMTMTKDLDEYMYRVAQEITI
ncbi:ATP-dependent 6-phosphofructokinase [bioreactor metagenome]|uniref:6-phosphofructokinase n=1 Tax=bioreactor metagenome TaxID=1076179 RepID=A0A645B3M9_9ZZZZ